MKYFTHTCAAVIDARTFNWVLKKEKVVQPISVAIIGADGAEYYAVSKDFNLKKVWRNEEYREGILKPIFEDLQFRAAKDTKFPYYKVPTKFTCRGLKTLLTSYGKTTRQINEEVVVFMQIRTPHFNSPSGIYGYQRVYEWMAFGLLTKSLFELAYISLKQEEQLTFSRIEKSFKRDPDNAGKIMMNPLHEAGIHSRKRGALTNAKESKQLYEFLEKL